ncbi:MAG: C-terminal binding protein [Gaiella sp.]
MRVLVDPGEYPVAVAAGVLEGLGVTVEAPARPWDGEDVVGAITWYPLGAVDFDRLPALRVAATYSVGFDHIDVAEAAKRGIWVTSVPDYCVEEMADHALALLLSLVRGVVELDRSVRSGAWDSEAAGMLTRISDQRLGVIGFGRIGSALARRALALGIRVSAHDPFLEPAVIAAAGVEPASLDDLLGTSTAISLHLPLSPATAGLLGREQLELLPSGGYVVNVSRAGLVDTAALLELLDSGHLGGVAMDVLDVEPPTAEAPAPARPRLVVNPHAGWYSPAAEEAVYRRAAESVRAALLGETPPGAVNTPTARPAT